MCNIQIAINFHQINMSFLSFTIDWKTAQLSTYPICSVVEQVPAGKFQQHHVLNVFTFLYHFFHHYINAF